MRRVHVVTDWHGWHGLADFDYLLLGSLASSRLRWRWPCSIMIDSFSSPWHLRLPLSLDWYFLWVRGVVWLYLALIHVRLHLVYLVRLLHDLTSASLKDYTVLNSNCLVLVAHRLPLRLATTNLTLPSIVHHVYLWPQMIETKLIAIYKYNLSLL